MKIQKPKNYRINQKNAISGFTHTLERAEELQAHTKRIQAKEDRRFDVMTAC